MASPESIAKLLERAIEKLDEAALEISQLPLEPKRDNLSYIAKSVSSLAQLQRTIYDQFPELEPETGDVVPDPEPTPEQLSKIEQLSDSELEQINSIIMSHCKPQWRKVAMVVSKTMSEYTDTKGLPDVFYSSQIRILVKSGQLESQGNLLCMRYSEIRLPEKYE